MPIASKGCQPLHALNIVMHRLAVVVVPVDAMGASIPLCPESPEILHGTRRSACSDTRFSNIQCTFSIVAWRPKQSLFWKNFRGFSIVHHIVHVNQIFFLIFHVSTVGLPEIRLLSPRCVYRMCAYGLCWFCLHSITPHHHSGREGRHKSEATLCVSGKYMIEAVWSLQKATRALLMVHLDTQMTSTPFSLPLVFPILPCSFCTREGGEQERNYWGCCIRTPTSCHEAGWESRDVCVCMCVVCCGIPTKERNSHPKVFIAAWRRPSMSVNLGGHGCLRAPQKSV